MINFFNTYFSLIYLVFDGKIIIFKNIFIKYLKCKFEIYYLFHLILFLIVINYFYNYHHNNRYILDIFLLIFPRQLQSGVLSKK